MMETVRKALQYIMSDLQPEPVIAAALPECELIRAVASCIKLGKTGTSSEFQAGRFCLPADNSTNLQ